MCVAFGGGTMLLARFAQNYAATRLAPQTAHTDAPLVDDTLALANTPVEPAAPVLPAMPTISVAGRRIRAPLR